MQEKSDAQLLRDYAEGGNEAGFRDLVARHTDLVYSAALRQVGSPDLARDVAQSVFTALARKARSLLQTHNGGASLLGWLYRSTHYAALNQLRDDRRRQARERQVMEHFDPTCEAPLDWERVQPLLDEAMSELSDDDREALLLRFFKNRDLRAIGDSLGVSEDAAQKRVRRALEKLRAEFVRRGVTTSAVALSAALSAHAVQAAPAGLAVSLSSNALGAVAAGAAATTAAGAVAVSLLQKSLVVEALALLAGTGIYQAHQASVARAAAGVLGQRQAQLAERIQQLGREREDATNRLAETTAEVARLRSGQNATELLKARGEVGVLRRQLALVKDEVASPPSPFARMLKEPNMREYMRQSQMNFIKWNFGSLFRELKLTPDQTEQAVQLMGELFLKSVDKMYSVPQGTLNAADLAQAAVERQADLEKELRPVWGDNGCAKFKQFFEEIPAHATVDLLNAQLGGSQLTGEQGDRLYKIVKAEPFDLVRGMADMWDPAFWGTQEYVDNHLLKIADSNQRVLDQASNFLTPEQLSILSTVLSNGINSRIKQAAALIPKP